MKRETRANLIFLCIFLALALPGIVKLTRSAYRSGGRDPAMRPAVRGEFAYMDPSPPIGLPRVVPPDVGRHVKRIAERLEAMQPGLKSIVSADQQPLMSKGLNLQVLAHGVVGTNYNVALFGWNSRYAPLPELYKITATRGSEAVSGQMIAFEPQNLPIELRSELQEFGYVLPPDSVLWFIASFPGHTPVDSLSVHFEIDNRMIDDSILLAPASTQPTTAPSPS